MKSISHSWGVKKLQPKFQWHNILTTLPFHSLFISDLLQLGGSAAFSKNPFSSGINGTNPFSDHGFDPFASKDPFLDSGKEINQNIQVCFLCRHV